jgi:hypothetical protein
MARNISSALDERSAVAYAAPIIVIIGACSAPRRHSTSHCSTVQTSTPSRRISSTYATTSSSWCARRSSTCRLVARK